MLTNKDLSARKPETDAPVAHWIEYRTQLEFVEFMSLNKLNIPEVAQMFGMHYNKLRSIMYSAPGSPNIRRLQLLDLHVIAKAQSSQDWTHPYRINIHFILTGNKETIREAEYKAIADSRLQLLEDALAEVEKQKMKMELIKELKG